MAKKSVEIKIEIERLKKSENILFNSKYDLFNAVLPNFEKDFQIEVKRKDKDNPNEKKPYNKTVIKPRISDYLTEQIKKYCTLVELGEQCIIEEVYEPKTPQE